MILRRTSMNFQPATKVAEHVRAVAERILELTQGMFYHDAEEAVDLAAGTLRHADFEIGQAARRSTVVTLAQGGLRAIENDRRPPTEDELARIARVLGYEPSFIQRSPVTPEAIAVVAADTHSHLPAAVVEQPEPAALPLRPNFDVEKKGARYAAAGAVQVFSPDVCQVKCTPVEASR